MIAERTRRVLPNFRNYISSNFKVPVYTGNMDKPVFIGCCLFVCLYPEMALAAPWDGGIQKAIDLLTGKSARLLAVLAFVVLGYLAIVGRASWGFAGSIMGGIVLIFGAAWFADTFIGSVSSS